MRIWYLTASYTDFQVTTPLSLVMNPSIWKSLWHHHIWAFPVFCMTKTSKQSICAHKHTHTLTHTHTLQPVLSFILSTKLWTFLPFSLWLGICDSGFQMFYNFLFLVLLVDFGSFLEKKKIRETSLLYHVPEFYWRRLKTSSITH